MNRNNISKANFRHITSSAKTPEAAMCVPISIEGQRIGVMIIHQWRRIKVMNEHDLLLLEGFAEQAAIAIQNARYYSEAKKRIVEITKLSEQLQEKTLNCRKGMTYTKP